MNVSFAVQAHPARKDAAEALAASMGGEVVYDPDPTSAIRSPWRAFRAVLEATPGWATHRLQIQDDAEVCPGFHEAVERAVKARPDRLLVFFVSANPYHHAAAVTDACRRDESWAELQYAYWCPVVCSCWPVGMIGELLAFVDEQHWPDGFCSDDERVGRWVSNARIRPLASVPSLVDHPDELPSIIKPRAGGRGRVAVCYVGDCGDCVESIDWTVGPG